MQSDSAERLMAWPTTPVVRVGDFFSNFIDIISGLSYHLEQKYATVLRTAGVRRTDGWTHTLKLVIKIVGYEIVIKGCRSKRFWDLLLYIIYRILAHYRQNF